MSQERRKRKAQREQQPKSSRLRKLLVAVLIVAAFAAAYYLGHKRAHRYDVFAQCLAAKQVKMYGAYWCSHCAEQKEMFGTSFGNVPYIECGIRGQRGETQQCKDAGVTRFPTWKFPDGDVQERVFPLQELSEKTGCALP
ncbi:MAG: hypothetical protein DMG72_07635 [Acidobacteria bacterium]|nr:MAG: hypothetical protein DMG72_07635 [Acidobacteriota bacterium]